MLSQGLCNRKSLSQGLPHSYFPAGAKQLSAQQVWNWLSVLPGYNTWVCQAQLNRTKCKGFSLFLQFLQLYGCIKQFVLCILHLHLCTLFLRKADRISSSCFSLAVPRSLTFFNSFTILFSLSTASFFGKTPPTSDKASASATWSSLPLALLAGILKDFQLQPLGCFQLAAPFSLEAMPGRLLAPGCAFPRQTACVSSESRLQAMLPLFTLL